MATIGNLAITYADWAKRMDDNYKVANIIEILSQTNEILDDMLVMEGNLPTGHKTTIRTGLPGYVASAQRGRPECQVHDCTDRRHLRQPRNLCGYRQGYCGPQRQHR